jgi:hypothetical protein
MDMEGLGALIEANHSAALRQFEEIRNRLTDCKSICNDRISNLVRRTDDLDGLLRDHARTLIQMKTIGSLLGVVWGAVVVFVSNFIAGMGK